MSIETAQFIIRFKNHETVFWVLQFFTLGLARLKCKYFYDSIFITLRNKFYIIINDRRLDPVT